MLLILHGNMLFEKVYDSKKSFIVQSEVSINQWLDWLVFTSVTVAKIKQCMYGWITFRKS